MIPAAAGRAANVPRALVLVAMVAAAIAVVLRGFQYYGGGAARHHLETAWIWFLALAVLFLWTGRDRTEPRVVRHTEAAPPPWIALFTIPLAGLLYLPAIGVGFLSDDFVLAAGAARHDFSQVWTELFRPVPLLLFRAFGSRPAALHLLNIVLHGVNAALVARIARGFCSRRSALVAAALFLAFPASVEAVAWCSGIQDVLMTTLTLAAVDMLASRTVLAPAPLAAALLTKETAVATPILAAVVSPDLKRVIVFASVVLVYGCWRILAVPLPESYAVRPSAYALKELASRAFGTLAVPVHSASIGGRPWLGGFVVAGFVLVVLAAAFRRRSSRTLSDPAKLILWILASVAPVYSYFFITDDLAGSRYLYLASAGWAILLALLLVDSGSRAGFAAALIVCGIGALLARSNMHPWLVAAATRDQVISAVRARQAAGCGSVWLGQVPDSVQGAFVFRNGLQESIRPVRLDQGAPEACRITVLDR